MSRELDMSTQSGRSMRSIFLVEVGYKDLCSRDRMSAGLESEGTHSIHTRHPKVRHVRCQAEVIICMSQDLLQPFVRAQQTDLLSMKKRISLPRM